MISLVRKRLREVVALTVLVLVGAVVAVYILDKQRLRLPFVSEEPITYKLEMQTAQAVTPGQGQTIRVSGIRIGDVSDVELHDGRATISVEVDRKWDGLMREDASAFLRPKTGLKDMFIELRPGSKASPAAHGGATIPIHNTLPDVNPDEFLAGLDADTRDYLKLLLNGAGRGLNRRSDDLRAVLKRFEPTYRDLSRVAGAAAARNNELRRLVNSLRRLNETVAGKDVELAELIGNASRSFRALASERVNISSTVRELPPTLEQTETSLAQVQRMAEVLGPSLRAMRPAVRSMEKANRRVTPFAREAAPLLEGDIRPFVREARPLVRDLRPASDDLVRAEPGLTSAFTTLNHLFNLIGHNPNGSEGPDVADRIEGYLFYLAWVPHQSVNLFSSADAHGSLRPITIGGTCTTLRGTARNSEQLEFLLGLTGALTDPRVCGKEAP
jgi:phospholipid/cholesterol/gamma-HCH transport system substrate-binding protein